jgi:hypothetical protein
MKNTSCFVEKSIGDSSGESHVAGRHPPLKIKIQASLRPLEPLPQVVPSQTSQTCRLEFRRAAIVAGRLRPDGGRSAWVPARGRPRRAVGGRTPRAGPGEEPVAAAAEELRRAAHGDGAEAFLPGRGATQSPVFCSARSTRRGSST